MKTIPFSLFLVLSAGQILAQNNISVVELEKQVSLTAKIETFNSSQHLYDTCDTGLGWKSICLIDGKVWFGSDAGIELPKNQLINLTLFVNGNKIALDVSGLYNPNWKNEIRKDQFKFEKAEVGYNLTGFFSDGAGAYSVNWLIIKGKSLRTRISNEN
jgi:hypothetical protein